MKHKKTPRANLEKGKFLFFQIGLIVSISLILIAFEWTSSVNGINPYIQATNEIEEMISTPVFRPEPPKPKVPLPPVEEIEILPDDSKIEEIINIKTLEIKEEQIMAFKVFEEPQEEMFAEPPLYIVQEMPKFMGGNQAEFVRWIADNMIYPEEAVRNFIDGRIFLSFVVEKNGTVSNVTVLRGVHPLLDAEAVRVVSSSPNWTPGRQFDKVVRVQFTIPISFILK
ncbi:MAG: energy transducer TonB [Bacteroidota bacterium]|nr:energy transducer TonB [Bacteroidota bacterium]